MNDKSKNINIVVILGSVRPDNFTKKAAQLVLDELKKHKEITVNLIDPKDLKLPLPGVKINNSDTEKLQSIAFKATGVILATPEYHGSFSSTMKLIIDNLGFPSVLAGKPVALLGVAAGQIGAIKALEHLRSVCSHIGAIVLPGIASVANVQNVFSPNGKCMDENIEKRIRSVATSLIDYIKGNICPRVALEEIVREGTVDLEKLATFIK